MSRRVTYYNSSFASFVPFHPNQLLGGQMYLRKDQATVSSWVSDIGIARDFVQTTASLQPTISANSVDFDGVNDEMKVMESAPFGSDTIGSIDFACYWDGSTQGFILTSCDESGFNALFYLRYDNLGEVSLLVRNDAGVSSNVVSVDGLVSGYNYGRIRSDGSKTYFKINGGTESLATGTNLGLWFNYVDARDNIALGASVRNTTQHRKGELNKIYYNNTTLTAPEYANLDTFFSNPNNY